MRPAPRWLIERQLYGEWELVGSVEAGSADAAVLAARGWGPHAQNYPLRAIPWDSTNADQRRQAEYEDNLRFQLWQGRGGSGTVADGVTQGAPLLSKDEFHQLNRFVRRPFWRRPLVVIAVMVVLLIALRWLTR